MPVHSWRIPLPGYQIRLPGFKVLAHKPQCYYWWSSGAPLVIVLSVNSLPRALEGSMVVSNSFVSFSRRHCTMDGGSVEIGRIAGRMASKPVTSFLTRYSRRASERLPACGSSRAFLSFGTFASE